MSTTGRIILLVTAMILLFVAGLSAAGWAFDDANPLALACFAGVAWLGAQLP